MTGQGSAIPNWDAKREALDSLSDGKLAQSPAAHVAQASWRKENPTLALEMRELPGPTLLFLASTVAGRGILAASEAAGAPGLGELLTGTFGRNISGPLGYLARGASKMLAGAGQGALAQAVYPGQQGYGGSAVEGALTNLAGGALAAPLRNDISPEVADLARKTILQGVPVRTGQLPGSSFASRAAGKLLRMTKPDASALTSRVIASMGHNADILNGDTVDAAQDKIGQGFQTVASRIPQNIADPQLFTDLRSVAMNAHNGLAGQQTNHDAMLGAMRQIYSAASNGAIDGPTYLNLTQTGSALSNLQKSGKPLAQYASAARDALDDALQRAAPQESQQIQLLRNQYRNSVILDNLKDKATDANGVIDPKKLFNAVVGNYGGTSEASATAANAGNSVDIGTLAAGGNRFPQQPATHMTLPGAVGLGAMGGTALGLGEMEGFPLIEKAMEHPVMGLGLGALSAGYLGAGGLQNSSAYTNLLLSRAARNASPMLGGANPLVPMVHEAYRGDGTSPAPPPGPTQQSADWASYIHDAAVRRGIDPSVALRVAQSEGLGGGYAGDSGSSFGPFQLHYGGIARGGNAAPASATCSRRRRGFTRATRRPSPRRSTSRSTTRNNMGGTLCTAGKATHSRGSAGRNASDHGTLRRCERHPDVVVGASGRKLWGCARDAE